MLAAAVSYPLQQQGDVLSALLDGVGVGHPLPTSLYWAPAGWDGNRWSARSIHPAGLETNHVPDMSSFRDAANEASGGLSWLRPHNRVSIWEHLAEVEIRKGRATAASSAYGLAPAVVVSHSTSDDTHINADGVGASCGGDTVKKAAPKMSQTMTKNFSSWPTYAGLWEFRMAP